MLSEQRIEEIYYSMFCHFPEQRIRTIVDTSINNGDCNALVSNNRLIATARHYATVKAMAGFDSCIVLNYNFSGAPTLTYEKFDNNRCWLLKINDSYTAWVYNNKFFSEDHLKTCILTNQKVAALDTIYDKITFYRRDANQTIEGQRSVYLRKYLEAKEILEKGILEDTTLKFPFVSGYANYKDIDLQEAAMTVVLKYESESAFLAESENLRIRYTDMIRKETDIKNLKTILRDFYTEHYFYGGSL